jgi:general secretion pathway protein K
MISLRDRRGVALMLVLWLIVVLAGVAAVVVTTVRRQLDVVINLRTQAQARYAAESGLVVALEELRATFAAAQTTDDLVRVFPAVVDRLARLGEQPLGDARFQVTIVDLNGRIDLNAADEGTLVTFFSSFVDGGEAQRLADALQDWRDLDVVPRPQGAEADAYAITGSAFTPPNRPLRRLEELTRIVGFTEEITDAIAPYVTVWGGGRLNVNTASERVLSAFPGIGASGASMLIGARGSGGISSMTSAGERLSSTGAGGAIPPLTGVPQRVLVVSRGWVADSPLTHETQVVVQLRGVGPGRVPDTFVMAWEERVR